MTQPTTTWRDDEECGRTDDQWPDASGWEKETTLKSITINRINFWFPSLKSSGGSDETQLFFFPLRWLRSLQIREKEVKYSSNCELWQVPINFNDFQKKKLKDSL